MNSWMDEKPYRQFDLLTNVYAPAEAKNREVPQIAKNFVEMFLSQKSIRHRRIDMMNVARK